MDCEGERKRECGGERGCFPLRSPILHQPSEDVTYSREIAVAEAGGAIKPSAAGPGRKGVKTKRGYFSVRAVRFQSEFSHSMMFQISARTPRDVVMAEVVATRLSCVGANSEQ